MILTLLSSAITSYRTGEDFDSILTYSPYDFINYDYTVSPIRSNLISGSFSFVLNALAANVELAELGEVYERMYSFESIEFKHSGLVNKFLGHANCDRNYFRKSLSSSYFSDLYVCFKYLDRSNPIKDRKAYRFVVKDNSNWASFSQFSSYVKFSLLQSHLDAFVLTCDDSFCYVDTIDCLGNTIMVKNGVTDIFSLQFDHAGHMFKVYPRGAMGCESVAVPHITKYRGSIMKHLLTTFPFTVSLETSDSTITHTGLGTMSVNQFVSSRLLHVANTDCVATPQSFSRGYAYMQSISSTCSRFDRFNKTFGPTVFDVHENSYLSFSDIFLKIIKFVVYEIFALLKMVLFDFVSIIASFFSYKIWIIFILTICFYARFRSYFLSGVFAFTMMLCTDKQMVKKVFSN